MGVAEAPGRSGRGHGLGAAPPRSRSEAIYAGLLRAYPPEFRARYAEEMMLLFGDQLRDARAADGGGGAIATWFRSLVDLASSAVGQHLRKERTMAQSLATFEPTRTMKVLGAFAVAGGALLLLAFVTWTRGTKVFKARGWRFLSSAGAVVAFAGAAFAGLRDAWVPAAVLLVFGMWLAVSSRNNGPAASQAAPTARMSLGEARSVLGVSEDATPAQIAGFLAPSGRAVALLYAAARDAGWGCICARGLIKSSPSHITMS